MSWGGNNGPLCFPMCLGQAGGCYLGRVFLEGEEKELVTEPKALWENSVEYSLLALIISSKSVFEPGSGFRVNRDHRTPVKTEEGCSRGRDCPCEAATFTKQRGH